MGSWGDSLWAYLWRTGVCTPCQPSLCHFLTSKAYMRPASMIQKCPQMLFRNLLVLCVGVIHYPTYIRWEPPLPHLTVEMYTLQNSKVFEGYIQIWFGTKWNFITYILVVSCVQCFTCFDELVWFWIISLCNMSLDCWLVSFNVGLFSLLCEDVIAYICKFINYHQTSILEWL